MPSKALLLCAGMGSRLRPITYTSAKHVLPVANKPIIFYTIETLVEAGITDIGLVVGVNRLELQDVVGDGSRWDVNVSYIVQDNPLGTAHAVKIAEDWAEGEPFIMVLGDIVIEGGLRAFMDDYHTEKPSAMLMLHKTDKPRQFGIAEIQNGYIVEIEEKPERPKSDLAVAGIYLFDNEIFSAIDEIEVSPRGELELPDAIQVLMRRGLSVRPHMVEGWWKDTGRPEDVIDLNRLVLDSAENGDIHGNIDKESSVVGRVILDDSVVVERSIIRGPVIIGAGARITNAYIGPYTSIGEGCVIDSSEVEHSVIMEGSTIRGIRTRIESSLIGKNVELTLGNKVPHANRFVIGESCVVHLV
jgi:glucose-1-phosphate thymidylyltransferase